MNNVDKVVNYDVAVSVLGSKLSLISHARRVEAGKSNPDLERLNQLECEHATVWKARHNLRMDDREAIEKVLEVYGPQVKKELELA